MWKTKNDSQQGVAAPKKRRIKESGLGMQEKNSPASMQKHCKVPGILIAVPINKWELLFLKTNKPELSVICNKQLFKIGAHSMRRRNASGAEVYLCPVCKAEFKEKILLAIHIGTRH
jgi:hypothetical protein